MKLAKFLISAFAASATLVLGACNDEGPLPRNGRHYVPMSLQVQQEMRDKGMRTHAPILIRAFKQESELEVWKEDSSGKMALLKTFPMCRWSGQLGPKVREGDRQVPEGFYSVTQGAMNPNSSFYLSFNVGYPNQFDRQLGRSGAHIMVHGDCSSMGCFAMTDGQVADIYALTREAFAGGQSQVQLQSFPFRMTPENLAKYRNDPNIGFWKNLKQGHDHFDVTRRPIRTAACNGRYGIGSDTCDGNDVDPEVRSAVAAKQRADEIKVAELVSRGSRAVKRVYRDGDMHPVFKETLVAGNNRPVGQTRNGISRTDAIAFTPIELPVDQYKAHKSKGRSSMQIAELAQQEQEQAAMKAAEAATAGTSKTESGKSDPAVTPATATPGKVQPAATVRTAATAATPATATATSAAAATAPATAIAAAPAEPQSASMFQRVLSGVGLSNASAPQTDDATLKEITPHPVNVPLPPRRQAAASGTVGPQATAPKVPDIITSTQPVSSSVTSGFSKLQ